MAAQKTFNQVIEVFKYIADNHGFINSWGFGEFDEIDVTKTTYPLMFVVPQASTFDKIKLKLAFSIIVMDLPHSDETNTQDILSDTLQTCIDIKAYLGQNPCNNFYIENGATITPFNEKQDNSASGWVLNCELVILNPETLCDIPGITPCSPSNTLISATSGVIVTGNGDGCCTTAINVGNGFEIYKQRILDELQFRTLVAGNNITIIQSGDTITINSTASGSGGTASDYWSASTGNQSLIRNNNTNNSSQSIYSFVNGKGNQITNSGGVYSTDYATILAGNYNLITGKASSYQTSRLSVIIGGIYNSISESYQLIGNGSNNKIEYGSNNSILNGQSNAIKGGATFSTILGGNVNFIAGAGCLIGNSFSSSANSQYGVVLAGSLNQIKQNSNFSIIATGKQNTINNAPYSAIINGQNNKIENVTNSAIIGASNVTATTDNTLFTDFVNARSLTGVTTQMVVADANGLLSVQAIPSGSGGTSTNYWTASTGNNAIKANNGSTNLAVGNFSIVAGKNNQNQNGDYSVIGGGGGNISKGNFSFVGGGSGNTASGSCATVINGKTNSISGNYSLIGGGNIIVVTGNRSAVVTGNNNYVTGNNSIIGAGGNNTITGNHSVIGGGFNSSVSGNFSTIMGGHSSKILSNSNYSTIAGGHRNYITGQKSFIGGGWLNYVTGNYSTVTGGFYNYVTGNYSLISNGFRNEVTSTKSSILNGNYNKIDGQNFSFISGGKFNLITGSSQNSAILNGQYNKLLNADFSAIIGGNNNLLNGVNRSVIVGGQFITAIANDTLYADYINARSLTGSTTQMVVASSGGLLSVQASPYVLLSADTIFDSTSLVDIGNLSYAVEANKTYEVELNAIITTTDAAGVVYGITTPAASTISGIFYGTSKITVEMYMETYSTAGAATSNFMNDTGAGGIKFRGTVETGVNAGVITFQAQSNSGGSQTCHKNAFMKVTLIN